MVIEWGSVPWNRSGQAEVRDADDPLSPQAHHSGIGNRSLNEEICHSVNLQSTCDIEPYEPGGYRADGPPVRSGSPMSGPSRCCACPRPTVLIPSTVLQVLGGYVQYPPTPKPADQALREPPRRVNPAGYLQYLPKPASRQGVGSCSTGGGVDRAGRRRLGFRVPTTPMGAPNLRRFGVFPFLGGCGAFTGLCDGGGRYSGLWVVLFVSPLQCHQVPSRVIPFTTSRRSPQRWRRSSPAGIWLLRLVVLTVRLSTLSSKRWVPTGLSPTSTPTGWRLCSRNYGPTVRRATWNTRRVAIQAFASWCQARWPLASDLLAGVGPRRRRPAMVLGVAPTTKPLSEG